MLAKLEEDYPIRMGWFYGVIANFTSVICAIHVREMKRKKFNYYYMVYIMYLVMVACIYIIVKNNKTPLIASNAKQHFALILRGVTGTIFGIFYFYGLSNYNLGDFVTVV